MLKNPAVNEVQEVRQQLIKKHGGLKGYLKHLQQLDEEDAHKKTKRQASNAKPKVAIKKRAAKSEVR